MGCRLWGRTESDTTSDLAAAAAAAALSHFFFFCKTDHLLTQDIVYFLIVSCFLSVFLHQNTSPTRAGIFVSLDCSLNPQGLDQHSACRSRCSINAGSFPGKPLLPGMIPANLSPFQRVSGSALSKHSFPGTRPDPRRKNRNPDSRSGLSPEPGPQGSPEPGRQDSNKMLKLGYCWGWGLRQPPTPPQLSAFLLLPG